MSEWVWRGGFAVPRTATTGMRVHVHRGIASEMGTVTAVAARWADGEPYDGEAVLIELDAGGHVPAWQYPWTPADTGERDV